MIEANILLDTHFSINYDPLRLPNAMRMTSQIQEPTFLSWEQESCGSVLFRN
jgi:hypothetical protein